MTLTADQLRDAATGKKVHFIADGVEYVVTRAAGDGEVPCPPEADHEQLRQLLARSSAGNGWDEPGMEAYDHYPAR